MSDAVVKANFQGLMSTIKKSRNKLAPIYEAVTNALEAIFQKEYDGNETPQIQINFDFSVLLEGCLYLNFITVSDNGCGFDEENFIRFETLLDNSKGFNNRGSGRVQFLHRFSRVDIESTYKNLEGYLCRKFSCSTSEFVYDYEVVELEGENIATGTKLTFIPGDSLEADRDYYNSLTLHEIVHDIKRQFMLRFYLDKENDESKSPSIKITFSHNLIEKEAVEIKPTDMPQPIDTGAAKVPYMGIKNSKPEVVEWVPMDTCEHLKWAHFKLASDELSHNAVYLCSKGVPVEPLSYEVLKKSEAVDGYHYLTVFYGDVLDKSDNVSDSVDHFLFPDRKKIEEKIMQGDLFLREESFIFSDTIAETVNSVIPKIYRDIIDIKNTQGSQIEQIAREHGISLEIARKARISLGDDEQRITDKIYRAQADVASRENQKIQKVFKELESLNPMADNYQEDLENKSIELLKMIPQQNKEELGRYVIRREMVAELLKKILDRQLDYQKIGVVKGKKKDKEGLIHDLLFKRKSNAVEGLNDLWVLNEEYLHFDGCSELPINKITLPDGRKLLRDVSDKDLNEHGLKIERRPDIFLYVDEGKCVVIELKEPDTDLSDHLNQMTKYCNLIANFASIELKKFYCYLIGENIKPIDMTGDYHRTVNGDWVRTDLPIRSIKAGEEDKIIASSKIEVIKLSSIYERAHRRNKSFADKLGLRDLIEKSAVNENAA